jgi:excisionase family DNA binding protein
MAREQLDGSPTEEALKDYGAMMRVSEVAKELGVSPATVYRLADRGDLKRFSIRLTGEKPTVRIQKASVVSLLTAWLEGRQSDGNR